MEEFASQRLDFARIEEISQNLSTLQLAVPRIATAGEIFIEICRRAPEMQAMMREVASAAQSFRTPNDVEVMTKRFLLQVAYLETVSL